ncbi:MAG: hypothetical protein JNK14_04485 [Chitinophagaceae bacterium]|nr:hypothetical protein [Chitinophagaceae bacterium]
MKTLQHRFVELIPDELEEGVIYVSLAYCTAIHKCVCGCGHEVVTPLSPTDWKLTFDGKTISLYPSIGNWSFPCRSHYWIKDNRIEYSLNWTEKEVKKRRKKNKKTKSRYFKEWWLKKK